MIAASTLDEDKEMVEKYDIPDNHDSLEIRLFVAGNPTPLKMDEDDDLVYFFCFCVLYRLLGSQRIQDWNLKRTVLSISVKGTTIHS